MTSVFGGVGRPTNAECEQRRKQFVRLILDGQDWDAAVAAARILPRRAIVVLQQLHADGLLDAGRRDAA